MLSNILLSNLTFMGRVLWYISIVKPTRCTVFAFIFRVYWISLYIFRMDFLSIIRSSRLHIQHQVYVIHVSWLLASGHEMFHLVMEHLMPTSKQSTNLYDIYLMSYVQSWTPDDGWKDRPKHVVIFNKPKICASSWFYKRKKNPAVKFNYICSGNYCRPSVWILTQQVNYWSYILHLSNTWEKMGIQWSNTSAIYRLQKSLWFS
jgi:hypothetical protein